MSDHIKIGIFDSGIGGLTVAKEIKKTLGNPPMIYYGDTAHLPYGDKSKESIVFYCQKITEFLINKGCTHIVVACNTASAYGFSSLQKKIKTSIHLFNVIDPVVDYVAACDNLNKIGVIATKGTTISRVYPRRIKKKNKSLVVRSVAAPLLAPMIEEGFYNNNISQTIINSYLSKKELQNIEGLILGCTHYPLIESEVKKYYENKVRIFNSAKIVAKSLSVKIKSSQKTKQSKSLFYVSDYTESFQKSAKKFFGEEIDLIKNNIW